MKGPRGGGKTKLLSGLGFVKWYLQLRNTIDLGGSLTQAQELYNYFVSYCYSTMGILKSLAKEPTISKTETDRGNYFKAVAASQKQVRGPHPDTLLIDEMCEVKDELALSAIPSVMPSQHPLIILASTFHKIFGLFQEIWDNAEALGYVRFSWDIFDVCREFDPAIWSDEKLNREIPDLALLRARAKGRTGDPDGWVSIHSVIQMWREKSSLDWFDVECMGSRPSTAGLVNDPEDVDACTVADMRPYAYQAGADVCGGLDWGFQGMTAWTPWMSHKDGVKVQLENRVYTQVRSAEIIKEIVQDVLTYRIPTIHADSSHPFENADLRAAVNKALIGKDWRCAVIEVSFGAEKFGSMGTDTFEGMFGNYRAYFQRRLLRIPAKFKTAIWQHKRYHYQKNNDKPAKEDDHIPDASMLALKRWPLGKVASSMPKDMPPERDVHRTITGGLLDEQF
ncbi:MAG: hypothetical protein BGO51_15540 [Rhodospirillales bacterium 69-11]|nr:MAG: hypothetical protein BGO51_15540 [Rhodospirillales bacterium 69-11]